jgi:hypothetical protein
MTLKEQLLQAIETTPDPILEQVFNFLRFLKTNELPVERDSRLGDDQSGQNLESSTKNSSQDLSEAERLVRLNQLWFS